MFWVIIVSVAVLFLGAMLAWLFRKPVVVKSQQEVLRLIADFDRFYLSGALLKLHHSTSGLVFVFAKDLKTEATKFVFPVLKVPAVIELGEILKETLHSANLKYQVVHEQKVDVEYILEVPDINEPEFGLKLIEVLLEAGNQSQFGFKARFEGGRRQLDDTDDAYFDAWKAQNAG